MISLKWRLAMLTIQIRRETCKRGNSSVCPRIILNPASLVKTDPSLTLKIPNVCSVFHLSKFLSMITSSPRSAREVAFQTFPFAGAPAFTCKKTWIGVFCHLHLLHKLAVVRLLIVCLQVESATDSSVSDDRGEDLRAVDLLSLPPALSKHVN